MIKTITKEIKICDLCNKEVEEFASAREDNSTVVTSLTIEKFYVGYKCLDICEECSRKLIRLLNENFEIEGI